MSFLGAFRPIFRGYIYIYISFREGTTTILGFVGSQNKSIESIECSRHDLLV